ncbi:arginase family protein [Rhodococcus sp. IEGM 248]|uniref:arginase family protein n=1 Tax=Rhodococcus opacus TaxID=37919 RepID=UPI0013C15DD6|nr:arginase family protein [Rhodococcus opacus]MDV7083054.1 arginase family protein [Rhodococcus opacus]NDV03201.1 arginase family protein [Rhodococcus sp. IEGM 248]
MDAAGWFLLGAPWDCSGSARGEQAAPHAFREAGLSAMVGRDVGDAATVIDRTDPDERTGVIALSETVRAARALAADLAVAMTDLPGRRPLVVGGDCSILLGIFPALRRHLGSVGLWFVDGHPDYLDGLSSDTGETADMELAVLTGVGAEALITLAGTPPMVGVSDTVLIGHRTEGLDAASAAELARLPSDLRRIDAPAALRDPVVAGRQAAAWLAGTGTGVWLHLDLDVLDPESLNAVTYPQPGGLDWDQLADVVAPLARSPRLVGVSVADFRPDLDPTGDQATRVLDFLGRTLP